MAEFERVALRPRPKRDWLPSAGIVVAALIGLAILKPWGASGPGVSSADATALPTFFVRPTERTGPRPYDPILFGGREPDPAWELWPAGYVVEFGLAGPVKVQGPRGASPAPGESAAPLQSAPPVAASPSPKPARSAFPSPPVPTPVVDDGVVDLGTTSHLVALGINTPADVHIETVTLSRLAGDALTPVPVVRLTTYFESTHFIVIAPEDPAAPGQTIPWAPGRYRLVLAGAFGEVREIDLRVRAALD